LTWARAVLIGLQGARRRGISPGATVAAWRELSSPPTIAGRMPVYRDFALGRERHRESLRGRSQCP